jgi:hypothetical protein
MRLYFNKIKFKKCIHQVFAVNEFHFPMHIQYNVKQLNIINSPNNVLNFNIF